MRERYRTIVAALWPSTRRCRGCSDQSSHSREPRDELRMTQLELDASVSAFCDEEAERDAFEEQSALLDSPDIIAGARPVDSASAWPPDGLPHGEHPYDYGGAPGTCCTCWLDEAAAMCPLHGMDSESASK